MFHLLLHIRHRDNILWFILILRVELLPRAAEHSHVFLAGQIRPQRQTAGRYSRAAGGRDRLGQVHAEFVEHLAHILLALEVPLVCLEYVRERDVDCVGHVTRLDS